MGQNFLIDQNVIKAICDQTIAVAQNGAVLEIGPGLGALTCQLQQAKLKHYVAIELDKRLADHLQTNNIVQSEQLIIGDALKTDWDQLFAKTEQPCLVGNLPYSLSSPLLAKFVESQHFATAVLMLQVEMAQRVCAPTGTNDYNAFSAWMRTYCDTTLLFKVARTCFVPKPGVDSTVVLFVKKADAATNPKTFRLFLQKCFAQRRKTLINNLKPFYELTQLHAVLNKLGIDHYIRAQQLEPEQLQQIATTLYATND